DERLASWQPHQQAAASTTGPSSSSSSGSSASSASSSQADASGLISLEFNLKQEKKQNRLQDRKGVMTLLTATKRPVVLGEAVINLADFGKHNYDQTQIFSLARNGPTIVLGIKTQWRLFNGKRLKETVEKGVAGEILNLDGQIFFLQ